MGLFISLEIDQERCLGVDRCGKCIKACPVQIFGKGAKCPSAIHENEDECTLCELCLGVCEPGAILVRKRYEEV